MSDNPQPLSSSQFSLSGNRKNVKPDGYEHTYWLKEGYCRHETRKYWFNSKEDADSWERGVDELKTAFIDIVLRDDTVEEIVNGRRVLTVTGNFDQEWKDWLGDCQDFQRRWGTMLFPEDVRMDTKTIEDHICVVGLMNWEVDWTDCIIEQATTKCKN